MTEKYRYHLMGWSSNDAIVLKTLLHLMGNSLPYHWDESHRVADAALLLVDVSTPESMQQYLQMVAQYPEKWVIPYGIELQGYSQYLSKPVRSQGQAGLVGIFTNLHPRTINKKSESDDISSDKSKSITPIPQSIQQPTQFNQPTTVSADVRLLPVWEALQEGRSMALHFDTDVDASIPAFVIDGQTQQCYSLDRSTHWLRRFEGEFQNVGLAQGTVEKIIKKAQYQCYPLASMRWCLALLLWDGMPSPQTASLNYFQLQRWPDFALLPYKPQYIIISGCLSKKPMTIDSIAATIKQPHALVQNFINACAATGLLLEKKEHTTPTMVMNTATIAPISPIQTTQTTQSTQSPQQSAHPASGKGDLFAALLSKLRGGKTWVKPV